MVSPEPTRWNVPCRSRTCFPCYSARWLATNGTRCVMLQTKQDYTRRVWPWLTATGSLAFKPAARIPVKLVLSGFVLSVLVWSGPAWSAAVCTHPKATLEYTRFESRSCYVCFDPYSCISLIHSAAFARFPGYIFKQTTTLSSKSVSTHHLLH